LMEEQRSRGREGRVIKLELSDQMTISDSVEVSILPHSKFVGYDHLEAESQVLGLYSGGEKSEVVEGMDADLLTAVTPFYGESGGQVGDRGVIETQRGDLLEVLDTQHPTPQLTVHKGRVKKGRFQVGDKVR